ncbi:MAG: L-2-hydroxyglutarate oxidase [Chloroflexi bacterium]|nr:MAG: L-2-hydroxyglutarate oxidase [Chloroflexota bacterium]MBL1193172.1 L-2-hydroxyglutarate oxidase [Chloroflexota bacterium]NOH10465.1 L-2-hydroxyglutarate oxidase [Chloroflexota bacterium]
MSAQTTYDLAVIGGGIVGLATAMAITKRDELSVIVLEAEDEIAAHQTGHNSGVIHSGLYYKPGSLKAQNCVNGRELLYQFCEEQGVNYERCGKVVVAINERDLAALETLEERGRANGLSIERLNAEELKEKEPHAEGIAALWVPETGIVDYAQVAQAYARQVESSGGVIQTGTRLLDVISDQDALQLVTSQGEITACYLINCAGLQADRVAKFCGFEPDIRIVPFRGEYYELVPERRHLVKNLIYPVPDPRFPFLGVHFTRRIDGSVEAGPNAVLALKREGYRFLQANLKDMWDTFSYAGFWKLAGNYWQMGGMEQLRSLSKGLYVKALQQLIMEITRDDVVRAGAGVRAQALSSSGALIDDFYIVEDARMLHALNTPSPAATASISIGEYIANRLMNKLEKRMS